MASNCSNSVFQPQVTLPLASLASLQGRECEESFLLYTPTVYQILSFGLYVCYFIATQRSFHGGSDGKESACSAEDPVLEKGMATHSSILSWRIPSIEESGGLHSIGSQRVGHD